MPKVYLSPSDQVSNTYVVGNTNEAAECREICKLTVEALKRCGVEAKTNTTAGMKQRVAESDAWGADLHVPVHTNGWDGSADGTLLMCYDLKGKGYKACQAIKKILDPLSPGSDYSIQTRTDLYEIRVSKAPCAYVEVAFHDNKVEAPWIINHKPEIAEALAKGICNYFGVTYKAPVAATAPQPGDAIYRVQVGAFEKKANAERQLAQMRALGYADAFIAVVDGKLYRVQVGAFREKANAERLAQEIKCYGLSAIVTRLSGTPQS